MQITIPDEFFNEEELKNTPVRVAEFYKELLAKKDFKFTKFANKKNLKEMIIMRNIDFEFLCAHHLLPVKGVAHVGYIPNKWLCGASKLARAVDKFASVPGMQEYVCYNVAEYINIELEPLGVMVVMVAKHDCMGCRGVLQRNSEMETSVLKGVFLNPPKGKNPRDEFLQLLRVDGGGK